MAGSDRGFWIFFGGIWLAVGLAWLVGSLVAMAFFGGAGEDPALLWAFAGVGFVLSAAGGGIVVRAVRRGARAKRLMSAGIRLDATVVDVRLARIRINRQPRWVVRYRYVYSAGQDYEGESPALPAELARQWRPGDTAAIVADPRRPGDSLWLGAPRPDEPGQAGLPPRHGRDHVH
jgi:hypothetical protein